MAERRMTRDEFYRFAWFLGEPCGDGTKSCSRGELSREAPERLSLGRRTVQELMLLLTNWKARTKAGASNDELILLIDPEKVSKFQPPPARESRPPVTSDEAAIDQAVMKDIRRRGKIFKAHGVAVRRMTNPVVKIRNKLMKFSCEVIQASIERLLAKGELRRYQGTADTVETNDVARTRPSATRPPLVLPKSAPKVQVATKPPPPPPPPPPPRVIPVPNPKKEPIEMTDHADYLFGFLLPHEERIWQHVLAVYTGDVRVPLAYEQFSDQMNLAAFNDAMGRFAVDKILVEDAAEPGTFVLGIKPKHFGFRPNPRRIRCTASVETMALVRIIQVGFPTILLPEGYGFKKRLFRWYEQHCLKLPGDKVRNAVWVDALLTGYGDNTDNQPPYGPLGLVMLWEGKAVRTAKGLGAVDFLLIADPKLNRNKFDDLPFPTGQVERREEPNKPVAAPLPDPNPEPNPEPELEPAHASELDPKMDPDPAPQPPVAVAVIATDEEPEPEPEVALPVASETQVSVPVAPSSPLPGLTQIDAQLAEIGTAFRAAEDERVTVACQIATLSAKQTEIETRQRVLLEWRCKLLDLQSRTAELDREYLEKLLLLQRECDDLLKKGAASPTE